jgi:delta14-sterol reductase
MSVGYALLVAGVGAAIALDWHWLYVALVHATRTITLQDLATAVLLIAAYIGFLAVLGVALPGWVYPGTLPADGSGRLYYKCNGLTILCTLLALWLASSFWMGSLIITYLADHVGAFLAAANLFAFSLATFLLLRHRLRARSIKRVTPAHSWWRDWILGTELNPHVAGFELKFFWLRPSMMGWLLLNISIAAKQWQQLGQVTGRMMLTQLLMNGYILDYFWHERKMTTTWDIVAEHFGLMLIWGDLVFIPFVFSVPAWCLLYDRRPLSILLAVATLLTALVGGWIFRSANSQKDAFKRDPMGPVSNWYVVWHGRQPRWHWQIHAERKDTALGQHASRSANRTFGQGRLLASGWWSLARHSNYTGDLLLAFAFSMPSLGGPYRFVAFVYFFYLLLLLIHRGQRDEERCARKYGAAWQAYSKAVPFVLLPGIW